jgi:DNA-binding response OmpR family regulator
LKKPDRQRRVTLRESTGDLAVSRNACLSGGNDELDNLTAGDAIMPEKKILIVDDNADLVRITGAFLEGHGYSVVSASDVTEAIKAVQKDKPDLVILDVTMPGGNGLNVLRRLNAANPKNMIPVIVVTGMETRAKAEAFATGAADFYLKPVNMDTLLESIREELGQTVKSGRHW